MVKRSLHSWLNEISEARRSEAVASNAVIGLIDAALADYPESTELLCRKGDAIQLGGADVEYELRDALNCYESAVAIDLNCAEAYESIGYYFDVVDEKLDRAEASFRKALEIEAREASVVGLARVLAQMGVAHSDICQMLDASPFSDAQRLELIRSEIVAGMWSDVNRA